MKIVNQVTVLDIKAKKLIFGDESYTLNKEKKFLLAYLRDFVTKEPLKLKGLKPFIYQLAGTNFFENINMFGTGYQKLIDRFELESFDYTIKPTHRKFIKKILLDHNSERWDDKIELPNAYKVKIKYETVYCEDMAEFRAKFLCPIFPWTNRTNQFRDLGFLSLPIINPESDIIPFDQLLTKSLQFDILRQFDVAKKYLCKIPHIFLRNPIMNCLNPSKNSIHCKIDWLHHSKPIETINRKFFLEHYIPLVFRKSTIDHSLANQNFIYFLNTLQENKLITNNSFKIDRFHNIVFGSDMAFFNQKKNHRFFETLGDPFFELNLQIGVKINDIVESKVKKNFSFLHTNLVVHFKRRSKFNKDIYQKTYWMPTKYYPFFQNTDYCESVEDSICCHSLKYWPHYRPAGNKTMVPQLIQVGKGNNTDTQPLENTHPLHKKALYMYTSYSNVKERKKSIPILNTGEIEAVTPKLKARASGFYFYGDIEINEKCNFPQTKVPRLSLTKEKFEIIKSEKTKPDKQDPQTNDKMNIDTENPDTEKTTSADHPKNDRMNIDTETPDTEKTAPAPKNDRMNIDTETRDTEKNAPAPKNDKMNIDTENPDTEKTAPAPKNDRMDIDTENPDTEKPTPVDLQTNDKMNIDTEQVEKNSSNNQNPVDTTENPIDSMIIDTNEQNPRIIDTSYKQNSEEKEQTEINNRYKNVRKLLIPQTEFYNELREFRITFNNEIKTFVEIENNTSSIHSFSASKMKFDFENEYSSFRTLDQSVVDILRTIQVPAMEKKLKLIKEKLSPILDGSPCGAGKTFTSILLSNLMYFNKLIDTIIIIRINHMYEFVIIISYNGG